MINKFKSLRITLILICVIGLNISNISGAIPVSPNASPQARALLNFIHAMYGKKTLSGQMWSPWGIDEIQTLYDITGKYPAIRGQDYITESANKRENQLAIEWWKAGGIPTIMWHWGAPSIGEGYENSKKEINIDRCFEPGTEEYKAMWSDLKRIADHLTELRDANVPVLWRPMHECDGNWFWYGKGGGERFVKLWRTMFNYFTKERKLTNLIWVLCHTGDPKAEWDPGKEYYDLAGGDSYGKGTQASLFNKVKAIHGDSIPIPYHECGTIPDPDSCFQNHITWSWWMLWHTSHLSNHNKEDLKRIYNHNLVLTRDELPNIMDYLNYGAPGEVSGELVNTNASPEARMIYKYVQEQFGKKILAAQHGAQKQYDYVHDVTGKYAAIWGTDLIMRRRNERLMTDVIGWWKKGVIPTIMWHWGAPTIGEGYEQSKGKIDVERCFQVGTAEHDSMWVDLKRIADNLTVLRDAKVPVLWRPMHECSGGWFWWDKSGGKAFQKLWITMFNYFTKDRGLDNLIWVLGYDGSPSAEYDPGKAYYDIVGSDNYDKSIGSHLNMFSACTNLVKNPMPVAFHECGLPPDPNECKKDNAMWSWFMVWDSFIQKVDTVHLKKVYNSDLVITLDKLPNWSDLLKKSINKTK